MPQYIIRKAVPEDAEALIAYVKRIGSEPDTGILHAPGEFQMTVEQEIEFIQSRAEATNSVLLLAVSTDPAEPGEIVGSLGCYGGKWMASRHSVGLGVSIKKEWRDQGVGTALMQAAIQWARDTGIVTRIELEVFAHNARAIHVYEKLGFEVEGMKKKAYFKNGQFIDALAMALLL